MGNYTTGLFVSVTVEDGLGELGQGDGDGVGDVPFAAGGDEAAFADEGVAVVADGLGAGFDVAVVEQLFRTIRGAHWAIGFDELGDGFRRSTTLRRRAAFNWSTVGGNLGKGW